MVESETRKKPTTKSELRTEKHYPSGLRSLSDAELEQNLKQLCQRELQLKSEIIKHIAEVDVRQLYLARSYPSLFEYVTKELGYSSGSAQRRIDAARLLNELSRNGFDDVTDKISARLESGDLNLVQISKLQKLRREAKRNGKELPATKNLENILDQLVALTGEQTDRFLAQTFQLPIQSQTKIQMQADGSSKVEIIFTHEELQILRQVQAQLSSQTGGGLKETILNLARKAIQTRAADVPVSTAKVAVKNADGENMGTGARTQKSTPGDSAPLKPVLTKSAPPKSVTPKLRQKILNRDQCCQFKDPQTGRVCGTRFFLQVDHIQPRFAYGLNTPENLRALCRNHNLYRYRAQGRSPRSAAKPGLPLVNFIGA